MTTFLKEDIYLYAALVNIDSKVIPYQDALNAFLFKKLNISCFCPFFICRNIESLVEQFGEKPTCFFILTNSRSLSSDKVKSLPPEAQYDKIVLIPRRKIIFFS